MRKAALHNLGCKVNSYETEAMQEMLSQAGYQIVDFKEKADVYVINTCSVTNMADKKSRQMLHRAKKQNPKACVVGCGCYVQTSEEEAKLDPAIDIIIGNDRKHELLELLDEFFGTEEKLYAVLDINEKGREFEKLRLTKTLEHSRAFIKVQDGCNQFCSYCIIPYARGRVRSREFEDVIEEVKGMTELGYEEFVLSGIHLSSYGIDNNKSLIELIEAVSNVDGVKRIRLGSFEPRVVTDEFVERLSRIEQVCPHFHLSLQSGCDETLKRMNRKYNSEEFAHICDLFRKHYDNPALTTDVIVGFPGETDEEFEKTKDFLRKIKFYETHVFQYSKRKGTVAEKMPNQVPEQIKKIRSDELLRLTENNSRDFRDSYLGREVKALIEESIVVDKVKYMTGFTKEYIRVAVPEEACKENDIVEGILVKSLTDEIYLLSPKG